MYAQRKTKIDRKKKMKARRTFALMNMSDGSMMEEREFKKKKEFCCYSHPSGNQAPHRFFISFLAFPTLLYFYYYLYLIF
jgi:hypothetical protein